MSFRRCVKSATSPSSTLTTTPSPIDAALPVICAAVWMSPPPSLSVKCTSAFAWPWPPSSRAFTRSIAVWAATSVSATSTVPANVIDIAPIFTLLSAFADVGLVRSTTRPPWTHGMIRSRSRIAALFWSTALPFSKEWSSCTIGGLSLASGSFVRSGRGQPRVDGDLDLVGHLQGAEQRRVWLDAPVALLERRAAGDRPVGAAIEVEGDRPARADEVQVALDAEPRAVRAGLDAPRAERDRRPLEDLLVDRLGDVRLVVVAERLHAAAALPDAQRARVRGQRERALGRRVRQVERRLPRRDLDHEVVAGLRRGARLARVHGERPVAGPERVAAGRDRHQMVGSAAEAAGFVVESAIFSPGRPSARRGRPRRRAAGRRSRGRTARCRRSSARPAGRHRRRRRCRARTPRCPSAATRAARPSPRRRGAAPWP